MSQSSWRQNGHLHSKHPTAASGGTPDSNFRFKNSRSSAPKPHLHLDIHGFQPWHLHLSSKKKANQKTAPASAVSKWLAFTIKKPYRTSSQEMKWISPPTRIRENPQKTGSWRIWQLTLNLFLPSPAPYHPPSIYSFFGLGRWLGCWLSIRLHGPPEVETHRRNSFGKEINFRHGRSWENRLQHLRHRVTSRCRRSKRHKHKQSMT